MTERNKKSGGVMTNRNGLSYEKLTDLQTEYKIVSKNSKYSIIKFPLSDNEYIKPKNLFEYMKEYLAKDIPKAHGCKKPDECYINKEKKLIFIIEKKFQKVSGSVCEKIQTGEFKRWQYSRSFTEYKVVYIYVLSKFFSENCVAELEYLEFCKIPVFFGCKETFKQDITQFIVESEFL